MQLWRKNQNPLWIAFWGSLIVVPLWILSWREWHGAGAAVIAVELLFIALYLRHSYYAWHVAFVMNIWFAIYHLAASRHFRVDIVIAVVILIYLSFARHAYREHIRAHGFHKRM